MESPHHEGFLLASSCDLKSYQQQEFWDKKWSYLVILVLTSTLFTTGLRTLLIDLASIKVFFGVTSALQGHIVQHCWLVVQHCAPVVYSTPNSGRDKHTRDGARATVVRCRLKKATRNYEKSGARIGKGIDWTISTAQKWLTYPSEHQASISNLVFWSREDVNIPQRRTVAALHKFFVVFPRELSLLGKIMFSYWVYVE